MTTAAQARGVVRARIEAAGLGVTLCWQNETAVLPDTPAPLVYTEFVTEPGRIASFGGGRGSNRYRNPARIEAYVFVPTGEGLDQAETIAEQIAALFRSYRDEHISCFDASVLPGGDGAMLVPPGLQSLAGNYFWAGVEVSLHFDQIG